MTGRVKNGRAVMAGRREPRDSLDFYPTPAHATHAIIPILKPHLRPFHSAFDPVCGQGAMAEPLREHFDTVFSSDIHPYGYGGVADFSDPDFWVETDWIFANFPFNRSLEFTLRALDMARCGVAVFAQARWIETKGRYENLFRDRPPTYFCPFVERVTLLRGRLDPTVRTATLYAWFCWVHRAKQHGQLRLIPPRRRP